MEVPFRRLISHKRCKSIPSHNFVKDFTVAYMFGKVFRIFFFSANVMLKHSASFQRKLKIFAYAALPYTEYPLRMLKFEIRAEITEYDANGRGGACTKRCLWESVKNACGSLQMS